MISPVRTVVIDVFTASGRLSGLIKVLAHGRMQKYRILTSLIKSPPRSPWLQCQEP